MRDRRPPKSTPKQARPAGTPDPAQFLNPWDHGCLIRYLAWLRQAYGFLPVPSPRGRDASGPGVPLLDLFVPPRLTPLDKPGRTPVGLLELLTESRQATLLGEPGTGRSTAIGWLVHGLTDPGRNPIIDQLGRMVPIIIPLRVMPLDPQTRTLDALIAQLRRLPFWYDGMDDVLVELLACGQALFVLDDLDLLEGPGIEEAVHEAILDGIFQHRTNIWLMASTPSQWRARPVRLDGLSTDTLPSSLRTLAADKAPRIQAWDMEAFEPHQVRAYAHRWLGLVGMPAEERVDAAENMVAALAASPHADDLSARPATLALLGLVYTALGTIPKDRPTLVDWLVASWIAVLDEAPGAEAVPADARRAWVEALARKAEADRVATFDRQEAWGSSPAPLPSTPIIGFGDAISLLRAAVRGSDHEDPGDQEAMRFVGAASVRPGVLVARTGGLSFAYPEHQRFLAAVHLAGDLNEPTQVEADEAIRTLKGWSRTAAAKEHLLELFEVLAERPGLAERVYKQLLGRSRDRTLGELNDLGPLALALRDGGKGIPARVQGAAGRLVHEAIGRWARERKRVPTWAPDLTALSELTDLNVLDLSGCTQVTDLAPLSGMRKLERIDIHGCVNVQNLDPLAHLQSLRWADLRGLDAVEDVSPLAAINGLRWLDMGGCTKLKDLSPLTRLGNLQALVLHGCVEVEDLGPLTALRGLRALVASNCPKVFDLSPLLLLQSGGRVWVRGSGVRVVPPDLNWEIIGL